MSNLDVLIRITCSHNVNCAMTRNHAFQVGYFSLYSLSRTSWTFCEILLFVPAGVACRHLVSVVFLQKSKLPGVICIDHGHFCRSEMAMDAGTFDLENAAPRDSFHCVLSVTLHAAKKTSNVLAWLRFFRLLSQPDPDIVTDKVGLDIPTPTVSKVIYYIFCFV